MPPTGMEVGWTPSGKLPHDVASLPGSAWQLMHFEEKHLLEYSVIGFTIMARQSLAQKFTLPTSFRAADRNESTLFI